MHAYAVQPVMLIMNAAVWLVIPYFFNTTTPLHWLPVAQVPAHPLHSVLASKLTTSKLQESIQLTINTTVGIPRQKDNRNASSVENQIHSSLDCTLLPSLQKSEQSKTTNQEPLFCIVSSSILNGK